MGTPEAKLAVDVVEAKQLRLRERLRAAGSLIVALSGGADSAYLAYVAARELGERALAVTAVSPSLASGERHAIEKFVRAFGIRHEFIETEELDNPSYRANDPDRCYWCKDELFTKLDELARGRGFAAVAYGINADDTADFRPGHRAASEHRVLAPLLDVGLGKAEIRELSRRAALPTWDKPASACLASRIPYGTPVTIETLETIDRGEAALRALGFRQVRVRYHGELVRIEIAKDELPRALTAEMAARFTEIFKALGFKYVTLDLEGYRQGALNEILRKR